MITVRTATPEDCDALLAIYGPYVVKTAISFEYEIPTREDFRGRIEKVLKEYPYLVAEEDGVILGYAYAGIFHGREAYKHAVETSIYVGENQRGRGIGKLLYTHLEELLLKQNVYMLYACIARADEENDPHLTNASIAFHEHVGYRLVGVHEKCGYKFNRWYSIVWMERLISERPNHPAPFIPFSELND